MTRREAPAGALLSPVVVLLLLLLVVVQMLLSGRAGANYGQLHAGGSTTTTRRLGRLGRAAPSRTGRAPFPARRRSHSDV